MSTGDDVIPAPQDGSAVGVVSIPRPVPMKARRWSRRRGASGVFSAIAVIGLAAAVVAPTGVALAESASAPEGPEITAFSLAAQETQNITISGESGAQITSIERGAFEVYVTPTPTPTPTPVVASSSSSSSSAPASRPMYTGGGDPASWMSAAGIPAEDWGYVDYIATRESGWNPNATNRSSGACGLIQAYPCSKVPGNGYDPVDNLRWANGYAIGRYGSWAGAYSFWTSNHWW